MNIISLCWIYTLYKIFGYKSFLLTHGNRFLLWGKVSEKIYSVMTSMLFLICNTIALTLIVFMFQITLRKFTENNILTFLLITIMMRNHFCVDRVLLSAAFSLIVIMLQTKLCLHNPAFCHK